MTKATTREYNTLMNYLSEYTTGVMRKQLMHNRDNSFLVWSIINGAILSLEYGLAQLVEITSSKLV